MSVTIRPYRKGGWEVDLRFRLPYGQRHRERIKAPANSKSAAKRWGEDRERYLIQNGLPTKKKEVPTFDEFATRFIDGYARANQQKPSGIAAKVTILERHLKPFFKGKRLDEITNEDVQRLKAQLRCKAPKTVNNILTVLNTALRVAVEWQVIDESPCSVRLLKTPITSARFHDSQAYEALVEAAIKLDWRAELIVLFGGDAGLRCGEMMALEWSEVDLDKGQLRIQHSEWKGHLTATKGGRVRYVPLTNRLASALRKHRHLRSQRVLHQDDRKRTPLTQKIVQDWVKRVAGAANVQAGVHILRHTFCSRLAMSGAPTRAIQELAGHKDIGTTQRYMHLSPNATEQAIRLLDHSQENRSGDIVETGLVLTN